MPVHRVPIAKRINEKAALQKHVEAGIIAKVHEPTPGCSNEVIRETPTKFRLRIDPSQTGVSNAHFNEQLHQLVNANCFSLVDICEGFL